MYSFLRELSFIHSLQFTSKSRKELLQYSFIFLQQQCQWRLLSYKLFKHAKWRWPRSKKRKVRHWILLWTLKLAEFKDEPLQKMRKRYLSANWLPSKNEKWKGWRKQIQREKCPNLQTKKAERQAIDDQRAPFLQHFLPKWASQKEAAVASSSYKERIKVRSFAICCSVWNTHLSKKSCKEDNWNSRLSHSHLLQT